MAEKFKIDLLNIDKKLRVGQELKLKFENTIEQKQTFELIWEEPDKFYDKKPIKVILESKKADKKPSEYSQEISIPISAKNKYSGGTIIVRKRGNNPKELFSTELYPDVGESELKEVYWSSTEDIRDITKKENERIDICKNEDAFLHIKSLGLHTKIVQIKLTYTVNGKEETLCQGYNIPIKENKKTVIVYATEVLDYIQRIHSQECTSMITAKVTFENTSTKTTSITLKCEENAPKPQKSVYTTDRVLVEVAEENSDESETTAKNLLVGCIGRLEGTGKANDSNTLSLYTMQFYNLFVFDFIHLGKIMEDQIKDFKNNIEDRKKIVSILKNLVTEKNGNLKYKELRTLLEEAQKRRRPFWERQVCRDAWYEIDYRIDSNRYGSNQECPPGPVYIIPIYEENINYTIFASQNGSSAIISHSVNRNGNVENNKFASRAGIAFHTGNSTWSQGCITLNNTDQKNRPHEIDLFNRLFSGKHGLHQKGYIGNMKDKNRTKLMSKTTKDEAKNDAATRLRMLMIEERGVEGEIAVQCVKDLPIKDYNHDPKNDCRYYHHVKPKPIPQLALRKVELKITYTEKTIKEEREVLETKTRTILTPEITQTQNRDGGKINILAAQAGDTISALVQTSYEEDLSDIQTKDIKWKLTKGKTSETTIGSDYSYTIPETTAENTIIKLEVKVKVQSNCFIFKITVENNKKDVLKSQLK